MPRSAQTAPQTRSTKEIQARHEVWAFARRIPGWKSARKSPIRKCRPFTRRGQECQQQRHPTDNPPHALARTRAHLVHYELLAALHLAVGFEERGHAPDHLIVEGRALRAAAHFARV